MSKQPQKHFSFNHVGGGARRCGCGAVIAAEHIDNSNPTCPKCIQAKANIEAYYDRFHRLMAERRQRADACQA